MNPDDVTCLLEGPQALGSEVQLMQKVEQPIVSFNINREINKTKRMPHELK